MLAQRILEFAQYRLKLVRIPRGYSLSTQFANSSFQSYIEGHEATHYPGQRSIGNGSITRQTGHQDNLALIGGSSFNAKGKLGNQSPHAARMFMKRSCQLLQNCIPLCGVRTRDDLVTKLSIRSSSRRFIVPSKPLDSVKNLIFERRVG